MTWRIFWKFQEGLIRSIQFQDLIFFNNSKCKFDLEISPALLLCQKTLSTRCDPFYVSFHMNGVVGPQSEYIKHSNPKTKWVRFSGTPCSILLFKYCICIYIQTPPSTTHLSSNTTLPDHYCSLFNKTWICHSFLREGGGHWLLWFVTLSVVTIRQGGRG